ARGDRCAPRAGAVLSPRRRGRGAGDAVLGADLAVRGALSRKRGASAAPAAAPSGPPQPALVAAEAGPRSAAGGLEVRQLSPAARDLPRMPARRVRSAGAAGGPAARAGQAAAVGAGGLAHSLAVRGVLALQLRGELHLRRRCSAGGAARAGAVGGSGAAARRPGRRSAG